MVEIGDKAPASIVRLTSADETNKPFDLAESFKDGTTVLYFFPASFTGVCTKSSCSLRDDLKEFSDLNAKIYSVSTDLPFTHQQFVAANQLNYPVLSDYNRELIHAYGVVDDHFAGFFHGIAQRSLFAIKDGKITFKWISNSQGDFPPFDELKEHLK